MFLLVIIAILGVITFLFLVIGTALSIFSAVFGYDTVEDDRRIAEAKRRVWEDEERFARQAGWRDGNNTYITDARSVHYHGSRHNDYDDDSDRYIDY